MSQCEILNCGREVIKLATKALVFTANTGANHYSTITKRGLADFSLFFLSFFFFYSPTDHFHTAD